MWLNILFLLICSVAYAENPPTTLYDEGVKQGVVFNLNCTGDGIACSKSGITGTFDVSGAGGGGASGWTLGASNVGISTTNNVGIGTSLTTTAGLTVMSGNVGIGTWVPGGALQVVGSGNNYLAANVGIGSTSPVAVLDIPGTGSKIRMQSADGTFWNCQPVNTTGVFTCI